MTGEGIVIAVDGTIARVRVTKAAECMECSARSECYTGSMHCKEITAINDCGASTSDHVVFESDTGKVILSAFLVWVVPLLFMFAGYLIIGRFADGFWPIGGSFLFLAAAFIFLKMFNKVISGNSSFYPRITHIIRQDA